MLTVVCWLWDGRRPGEYSYRNVNALARMLSEHMSIPYRLVCITDRPAGIDCETFPLWEFPRVNPGLRKSLDAWRRLKMFEPETAAQFGARVLSMDLDVLVRDDLAPLIGDDDFRGLAGEVSPINASLWTLKVGTNAHVWQSFDPETSAAVIDDTKYNGRTLVGSDQAWMSIQMPHAATWSESDGVTTIHRVLKGLKHDGMRFIAFPGIFKPWHEKVRRLFPQLHSEYVGYF